MEKAWCLISYNKADRSVVVASEEKTDISNDINYLYSLALKNHCFSGEVISEEKNNYCSIKFIFNSDSDLVVFTNSILNANKKPEN